MKKLLRSLLTLGIVGVASTPGATANDGFTNADVRAPYGFSPDGTIISRTTSVPIAAAGVFAAGLDFASSLEAARGVRRGDVCFVELKTRMLDRIARFNPKINAIVTLAGDAALARARAADEARARGEWWGPFHGVPCTVKDTFEDLRGTPVAFGARCAGLVILARYVLDGLR